MDAGAAPVMMRMVGARARARGLVTSLGCLRSSAGADALIWKMLKYVLLIAADSGMQTLIQRAFVRASAASETLPRLTARALHG